MEDKNRVWVPKYKTLGSVPSTLWGTHETFQGIFKCSLETSVPLPLLISEPRLPSFSGLWEHQSSFWANTFCSVKFLLLP